MKKALLTLFLLGFPCISFANYVIYLPADPKWEFSDTSDRTGEKFYIATDTIKEYGNRGVVGFWVKRIDVNNPLAVESGEGVTAYYLYDCSRKTISNTLNGYKHEQGETVFADTDLNFVKARKETVARSAGDRACELAGIHSK